MDFKTNFGNGSFTKEDFGEIWNMMWEPEGTTHTWCSESHTDDGTGCLKIIHPIGGATASHISQEITLVKDAKYKITGYIKFDEITSRTANGNGGAYCTLGDSYIGRYLHQDVPYSSDWEYFESFYTATYTGPFTFSCKIWGAVGTAYFDDLEITLAEEVDKEVLKHWAADEDIVFPEAGFCIAAIGDPQIVVSEDTIKGTDKFINSMKEIVSIRKSRNISYVVDMGDITDVSSDPLQWNLTVKGHDVLQENGLRYAVCIGNHDYNGLIGLRRGVYAERNTSFFRAAFPYEKYEKWLGTEDFGSFDGTMLNTYHRFTENGYKYILITIEYAPTAETIEKIRAFCDANKDSHIIICTHCLFTARRQVTLHSEQSDHLTDAVTSSYMWDNLIYPCPNIFLTICGHVDCHGIAAAYTFGKEGNTITNVVVNPQGTLGGVEMMTALINITNVTDVTCYAYSPSVKKYYAGCNLNIRLNPAGLDMNGNTIVLPEGFKGKLFTHGIFDKAVIRYEYTSSDESVASVSEDGVVTALSKGSAVIRCMIYAAQSKYAEEGPGARFRVEFKVIV